jgi:4-amino-4-deoxy-L-arabinose transferase-like glycosyltransferase
MAEALDHRTGSPIRVSRTLRDRLAGAWAELLILGAVALLCFGISRFLPDEVPILRTDTLDNWIIFAERVLRSVLTTLGLVAVLIGVSAIIPQVGLAIERLVFRPRRWVFLAVTGGLAAISSGLFAGLVLHARPHIVDEIAMLFQAEILAGGQLYASAPAMPEFFDEEFIIVDHGRWYGKYFLGQSLLLVPGVWLGVPWLVHPLLAGVAVWLTYTLGTDLFNERAGRVAAVLMVVSPFRLSLFGMMMSHAGCLVLMAVFAAGVVKVLRDPTRWGWALAAGMGLGLAVNSRPLTAVSMGIPIGLYALAAMPWRRLRWKAPAAFFGSLAIWAIVFLGYNKVLTGDALLVPFNKWSTTDRLGFGPDIGLEYWRPEDRGHSLHKALMKDTYFNLDVLGQNLIGWGHVTLVLLLLPLIRSRWPARTWMLAAMVGCVIFAHLFHVSHGVLAGQARYWSESLPMMMLLVVAALVVLRQALPHLCRWLGIPSPARTGRAACWLTGSVLTVWGIWAVGVSLVSRCYEEFTPDGPRIEELVAAQDVDNAIVFVASGTYRDHFRGGDPDLYWMGFMLNEPDLSEPVIYARDLGDARNAALLARYPGRSAYRVDPLDRAEMTLAPYDPRRSAPRPTREDPASLPGNGLGAGLH